MLGSSNRLLAAERPAQRDEGVIGGWRGDCQPNREASLPQRAPV